MKALLIALLVSGAPVGEWQTEVKPYEDAWENWSERLILRFRLPEWDEPKLEPVINLGLPAIEA